MATEDDLWSLAHLQDCDERESSFGVGTFRYPDESGVVHRVVWRSTRVRRTTGSYPNTWRPNGWVPMCESGVVVKDEVSKKDPGPVTCFQCLGMGA